jgi:hypothetical protein
MSSEPTSSGEELSEYVRRPTRAAGDLSEVADASPWITTEHLARDLEAIASKQGTPTDSELLADLLKRVKRGPPRNRGLGLSPPTTDTLGIRTLMPVPAPPESGGNHAGRHPETGNARHLTAPTWLPKPFARGGSAAPINVESRAGESITGELMTKAW